MTVTVRFAPSPTGRLHLGHALAALFARRAAAGGRFLLRLEDIDRDRCRPEYETAIAADLAWLGLERATQALVVRPTLALTEALARFDDRVLDRGVAGSAAAALGLARRAATFDDRVLDGAVETTSRASLWTAARAARDDDRWFDGAVEGLAAQLRRLGRLARRPQTGQLHQYYIQAVAVLAIGVLLLVTVR